MAKYKLYCCVLIFISSIFSACAQKQRELKLGVMSDLHYLSEQLMDGGQAMKNYEATNGKRISDIPDILDIVLKDFINSNIDVLLIPGDLTKDGERQSHLDLAKKLQPLKEKGIHIYVIPGNHDINVPNPVGFDQDKTYQVDNVSPNEFTEIYNDYGYNNAISRDSSSLSYLAELDNDTWLLAIDACLYQEYKDKTISAGKISNETEQWILKILEDAKRKNIQVVGMMHHGLVEHIVFQSAFFKDYLVHDWQRLAPLFADNGMKIIFTGHFHANDITEYTTGKGNKIYDVETGALAAYPFTYRFADLTKNTIKISTKNVDFTPNNPLLSNNSKEQLRVIAERQALSKINSFGIHIPDSIKSSLMKIAGNIFVMHLAGDEVLDQSLRSSIKEFYETIDSTEAIPFDKFEIDLYPADNNVEIGF